MELTQPIVFEPLFMERVWGGRRLETLLGKRLPPGERIGESWELVDREIAQSVVHDGPLRGATLHELWTQHRDEVFGSRMPDAERFPLLFKVLDAQERLSLQVHPPAEVAKRLGGEPKTEMWYVLDTFLDADIYAGLNHGVTREDFVGALLEGRVADLVHRIPARAGDTLAIPSGRVHAIGDGNLIIEVQQNSDTTYRVFDWNRLGLDGKPRQLHVEESLQSIDFDDIEPGITQGEGDVLVANAHFCVEKWTLDAPRIVPRDVFSVVTVVGGEVECGVCAFKLGDFFLVPATQSDRDIKARAPHAAVLRTTVPR